MSYVNCGDDGSCPRCPIVQCVRHSGWCVCVKWSELLMTSAISCPLWSSVYECHKVECAFTSPVSVVCL